MDRQIVYPGSVPLETDLLSTNRFAMIALGLLALDILGSSTVVSGLACTPNSPAALNVLVGPGRIYSQQNVDSTAYSSLAADTTDLIVKQGISLSAVTLNCPAPSTAGYSVNYLIEAAFSEVDDTPVVLPYYNSSNPSQAYSGPSGTGTSQNTARRGKIVLTAKAGVAATTGTQTTPAADSGNVGLYVVTVANGQATITAGNISQLASAPFINTLAQLAPLLSPVFLGTPTAPTPVQGDNSTKLATTAFAQAIGLHASAYNILGANTTLTAANAGQSIQLGATSAPITVTLPRANTLTSGQRIEFFNNSSFVSYVATQGGDTVAVGQGLAPSTITLYPGDTLTVEWASAAQYAAVGGSAQLGSSGVFVSSLGSSGYKRTPDANSPTGYLLEQWGSVTAAAGGAATAVTFPIAFGTLCMVLELTAMNASTTTTSAWGDSLTTTGFNAHASSVSTVRWYTKGY